MNRRNMLGIAFVIAAIAMTCLVTTSFGETAGRLVGKAVWYLPYALLVGAGRCFAIV